MPSSHHAPVPAAPGHTTRQPAHHGDHHGDQRLKILLLAQFFPPDIGGEERHVLNLSTVLASRGHDVAVATQLVPGADPFEVLPSGVRVHRFASAAMRVPGAYSHTARPHHPPVPDPLVVRALRGIVDRERPQVVHAHNWIVNSAVALRRTVGGRPPFALVLTLHDYSQVCATKRLMRSGGRCPGPSLRACVPCAVGHYGPLRGAVTVAGTAAMRPWKARAVQHVISVSRAVAHGNRVERLDVPSSVVPNFIPDDLGIGPACAPGDDPAGGRDLPEDGFLFFVGDLSPEKGVLTLLDAYRRLGPDRPPLVLAGRPHERTPSRLPEGARILPGLRHEEVMEGLRRCGCAVLPSIWPDPCPTTVLEAMAAGRPVITTSTGGMVDMVTDGVNGLLVPPGDVAALVAAVRRVLDDPDLAARLAATARDDVAAFRASPVAERLEAVYRSALQEVLTG